MYSVDFLIYDLTPVYSVLGRIPIGIPALGLFCGFAINFKETVLCKCEYAGVYKADVGMDINAA